MKGTFTAVLAVFAATLFAVIPCRAQSTITMQASPYNCGRASTPLYCNGIPVTVQADGNFRPGGSIWIDLYPDNTGFVLTPLGLAQIVSAQRTTNEVGQVTRLIVAFIGTLRADDDDNDGDAYMGSLVLNFSYYYSAGGGGRGGAGAGWRFSVTSGNATVAVAE